MPAIAIATTGREKQKIDKITEGHTSMCGTLLYLACHIGVNCPICESAINVNRHSENNESIYYLLMVDTDQEMANIFGKCIEHELTRVLIDVNARSLISKHIFKCPSCEKELQNPRMNRPVKSEIFSNNFTTENGFEDNQDPVGNEQPSTSPAEETVTTPVEESTIAETVSLPSYSDYPGTPVDNEPNTMKRPYPYHLIEALNRPQQPHYDNNMFSQMHESVSISDSQYAQYLQDSEFPQSADLSSYNSINNSYKVQLIEKFDALNRVYKWREGKSFVAMCKKCDKSVTAANSATVESTTRSTLLRHIRIHVEINPYKCSYCDYSTKQIALIKSHINGKHPFQPVTFTDETEEVFYLEACLSILHACFDVPERETMLEREIRNQLLKMNENAEQEFEESPINVEAITNFVNPWTEQLPVLQKPDDFSGKSLLQSSPLVKFEGQKGGHYQFTCTLCDMLIPVRSVINFESSLNRLLFVHYNNAHPQIQLGPFSFADSS